MNNVRTNRRNIYISVIFILTVFSCFYLTGCCSKKSGSNGTSSASGSKTEIVFWNTMEGLEADAMEGILKQFHEDNPDIRVREETISFYEARDKFKKEVKEGFGPDVMRTDRFWIPDFAEEGVIDEISPETLGEDYQEIVPVSKEICKWNGKNWAVPVSVDCLALFYNKKHLKEKNVKPPRTFDEFAKAAKTLTDGKGSRYGFFIYPNGWYFEPILFGFGAKYFDDKGNIALKSDATKRAFDFLRHLKAGLKVVPQYKLQRDKAYGQMLTNFKNGQISMMFNGPWAIREILEGNEFKKNNLNLGIAQLPAGPSGTFSPTGCQALVIASSSKKKEAALKFVKYMFSEKIQKQLVMVNYGMPARKSVFKAEELKKDPYIQTFIRQLQMSRKYYFDPKLGDVYGTMNDKLLKFVNDNNFSAEYAISDIITAWNRTHSSSKSNKRRK